MGRVIRETLHTFAFEARQFHGSDCILSDLRKVAAVAIFNSLHGDFKSHVCGNPLAGTSRDFLNRVLFCSQSY